MPTPQLQVANCPRCNKIFQLNNRSQCADCCREMDSALSLCFEYLRRNYKSTDEQISEGTGVPIAYIRSWIKEGKIYVSDYPNLNYPCSSCGKRIRTQKMCIDCITRLNREIMKLKEKEQLNPFRQQEGGFQIRERFGRLNNY